MSLSGNLPVVKPTFSADFVNTERVDHRLTFARASTATFYDGVTTAKADENLLLQSQTFDNASWTKLSVSISADSIAAPDGTITADTITATAGTSARNINQTAGPASAICVLSVFAKANTLNFLQLYHAASGTIYANFDLSTGVLGTVGAGATATITSVGGGWYRCSIVFTPATAGANRLGLISSSTAAYAESWTAAGTESIYLWGAQLEQRSAVTAYTATTTAPITNYIHAMRTAPAGVGRIAHDPITRETLGLHMESAATNLLTYSEDLGNANWQKTNATVLSNCAIAPNGTQTADKIVEALDTAQEHYAYSPQIVISANTTYTASIYAKAGERTQIQFRMWGASTFQYTIGTFDLSSGTLVLLSTYLMTNASSTITSVGNGWYRITLTGTTTTPSLYMNLIAYPVVAGSAQYNGNGFSGIYVWGVQFETGSLATSYIPTVASQVTRAADTCTLAAPQFDAAIRQGEGTLYAEVLPTSASGSFDFGITNLENGTYSNLALRKTAGVFVGYGNTNGVAQFDLQLGTDVTVPYGVVYKSAVAYAVNNFGATSQGLIAKTDSLGVPPEVSSLRVGPDSFTSYFRYNNYIRKVAYYPTRLPNLNLEALTL